MRILIELLVFVVLIGVLLLWGILMFVFKKIKLWRYKPENDKGKLAEEERSRGSRFQRTILPTPSKRPNLFPTTPVNPIGETKPNIGKTSRSNGKLRFYKRRSR